MLAKNLLMIFVNYNRFLNRDCKHFRRRPRPLFRGRHLQWLALLSLLAGLAALFGPSDEAEAIRSPSPDRGPRSEESLALPEPSSAARPTQRQTIPRFRPTKTITVAAGDTLSGIFLRVGLGANDVQTVLHAGTEAKRLSRLQPGQTLAFTLEKGRLRALHYTIDALKTLAVTRDDGGFQAELQQKTVEYRIRYAAGTIHDSLFVDGQRAGLSDALIMELAAIFGWDVDFALDLRPGDRFAVLYRAGYLEGEKIEDGAIVAAEFINQGRRYRAVRFTDAAGRSSYYSPDGHSMRKAFLRTPVDFRRISSRFQKERFHPILGRRRPHMGVDYAASVGTPIKAAGDGRVIFRGWKGGYGRVVIVRHAHRISTLYGHMSRFNRRVKSGSRVKQGQVIGYVGQSGLATGPHLHYEFRVNGVHRNPLTVKLPAAAPIAAASREAFKAEAAQRLAQLAAYDRVRLAADGSE